MDYFNYRGADLYAEDVKVTALAEEFGTPLYVYSKATLERHVKAFEDALKDRRHLVCFAVKANGSLSLLNLMARLGCGFDIVSEGELRRVIAAGGDPHKCVYSGVGKTEGEIAFALSQGIKCLNVESEAELDAVSKVAGSLNLKAPVALRVNPNVDAKTLPAISTGLKNNKFGISSERAFEVYKKAAADPHLLVSGIDCHIGSQMVSGAPILEALDKLLELYEALNQEGIKVDHLDVGGGLGVTYDDETPPSPETYFGAIERRLNGIDVEILVEPGRAMVANAGIFVTKVSYLKQNGDKRFVIVDGGMNDLIRPALYNSWMNIINAVKREGQALPCDIVGPICESDDFFGKDRRIIAQPGDILAVRGAGAYGSSMSSTYNSHPLCAEVLVDGEKATLIRRRQSYEQIWENEILVK